jgi:adenylate cyclase
MAVCRKKRSFVPGLGFAAVLGHLGEIEEARRVWRELMAINPKYSFAERIDRMTLQNQADAERISEGLRKAGLPD